MNQNVLTSTVGIQSVLITYFADNVILVLMLKKKKNRPENHKQSVCESSCIYWHENLSVMRQPSLTGSRMINDTCLK